jgi:hypothetical protein
MRRLMFLLLLISLVGCRESTRPTPTPTGQEPIITLISDPHPPQSGDGMLVISVTQPDGTLPEIQKVAVRGDMTHAGMRPEFGETVEGENGVYRIPFNWSMGGDWIITVTLTLADDSEIQRTFEITVNYGR